MALLDDVVHISGLTHYDFNADVFLDAFKGGCVRTAFGDQALDINRVTCSVSGTLPPTIEWQKRKFRFNFHNGDNFRKGPEPAGRDFSIAVIGSAAQLRNLPPGIHASNGVPTNLATNDASEAVDSRTIDTVIAVNTTTVRNDGRPPIRVV